MLAFLFAKLNDMLKEEFKAPDKPIYEDSDFKVYHFTDANYVLQKTNIADVLDPNSIMDESDEHIYVVAKKAYENDYFVSDDDEAILITINPKYKNKIEAFSSPLDDGSGYISSLDDLTLYMNEAHKFKDTWKFINDNILKTFLFKKVNSDSNGNYFAEIPMKDVESAIHNHPYNGSYLKAEFIRDILSNDAEPYDCSYLYQYDLPSMLFNSIDDENMKALMDKFKVSEKEIESVFVPNKDLPNSLYQIYQLIFSAYVNSIQNKAYANVLEQILDAIRDSFPAFARPYIEVTADNITFKNMPKEIYSQLIDDYIDEESYNNYVDSLYYGSDLKDISKHYLDQLMVINKEENNSGSYEEFDEEEFNELLSAELGEI